MAKTAMRRAASSRQVEHCIYCQVLGIDEPVLAFVGPLPDFRYRALVDDLLESGYIRMDNQVMRRIQRVKVTRGKGRHLRVLLDDSVTNHGLDHGSWEEEDQ